MTAAYYNEFDPFAAAWLRKLIAAGHLPAGDVDERSITEVKRDDIKSYTQCHFFAGIGGWPLAFRIAGWPDDRPVWSGSAPCGPYSIVGQRQAFEDERDLWPAWMGLMDGSEPDIFGEQVADAIPLGWYDRLADDMGTIGKSCWPAVLPACSAGRPHEGERLFFVAKTDSPGLEGQPRHGGEVYKGPMAVRHATEANICDFIRCADGYFRPVPCGYGTMDDGLSHRVGKLRGYGNAIVPQVAAEFIRAVM